MDALQTRLQQYETSASHDEQLLKQLSAESAGTEGGVDDEQTIGRRQMAIEVRLSEKKILANAQNEAAAMVRDGEARGRERDRDEDEGATRGGKKRRVG